MPSFNMENFKGSAAHPDQPALQVEPRDAPGDRR